MREEEMNCKEICELLTAYLDGEVTPEEQRQVEAHLSTCPRCHGELKTLTATREELRQALSMKADELSPSPELWEKLRQRIETTTSLSFWERYSAWLNKPVWRTVTATVLVVVIAVGVLWGTGILPGLQSGKAPVPAPSPTVPAPTVVPRPTPAPVPATTVPPPVIAVPPPSPTSTPSADGHVVTSTKIDVKPGDNTISISGLMIKLSLDDLVRKSDVIVIGKVTQILPSKQSESILPGRSIIYTDVLIHTERYLYGKQQSDSIAVQVWGGRIGNTVMVVGDMPVFNLGEEVVLFLQRLPQANTPPSGIEPADYYTVYGSAQGKYAYGNGTVVDLQGNRFSISEIEQKIASLHRGQ